MTAWIEITEEIPAREVVTFGGKKTFSATIRTEWHTAECLAWKERVEKAQADYLARWPNHCRKCGGTGGHTDYQSVPYGSTWTSMPIYEVCECVDSGICPRCAQELDEHNGQDDHCSACGWDSGDDLEAPFADEWECYCWERSDYPDNRNWALED